MSLKYGESALVETQLQKSSAKHTEFILDDLHQEIDPQAIGGTVANLPEGYYRSWSFLGTFAAATVGVMCCYVSLIMPVNLLSIINADIGPSTNYVWISLVWTLACAVVLSIGGRITDIFGRRWFFIVGNFLGTIGAIVGATAQSINTLIGATALIGIGAGVQTLWPMAIDELVPNKDRGVANVLLWTLCLPFATFAPVIGRAMVGQTGPGWRGVYYLMIALSGASTLLFYVFYHPPTFELLHKGSRKTLSAVVRMIDFGGIFLLTAGLVLFLLGVSWGGQQYPWKSGQVIGCIVAGVVVLVIFVLYEVYFPQRYLLIPMHLFQNKAYVALTLAGAFCTLNFYTLNILWPMQASVLYTSSVIEVGWLTCATGAGAQVGQVVAGLLIRPLHNHRWQVVFYATMGTVFTAALSAATTNTRAMAATFVAFSGFSVGAIESVIYTLCPLTLAPEDIGLAIGVMLSVRLILPCISVAIYLTVLTNRLATNIPRYVAPAAIAAGLPAVDIPLVLQGLTTGNFSGIPNITPGIILAAGAGFQEAYTQTFKVIYLSTLPWGAVAIFCAFFSPNLGSLMNDFVGRRLHGRDIQETPVKSVDNEGEHGQDMKVN